MPVIELAELVNMLLLATEPTILTPPQPVARDGPDSVIGQHAHQETLPDPVSRPQSTRK